MDFMAADLAQKLYERWCRQATGNHPAWADLNRYQRNDWHKMANDLQNTLALQRLRFASATQTASSSQQS